MSFLVTTTGTQIPVEIQDLGAYVIPHPSVDLNIMEDGGWSSENLFQSSDLQSALTNGHITMKRTTGSPVFNIQSSLLPIISEQASIAQIAYTSSSLGVTSSADAAIWVVKITDTHTYYPGEYILDWNFLWTGDSNSLEIPVEVYFDGNLIWSTAFNTATTLINIYSTSGMKRVFTITSEASKTFELRFKTTQNSKTAYMKEATFIAWRIG